MPIEFTRLPAAIVHGIVGIVHATRSLGHEGPDVDLSLVLTIVFVVDCGLGFGIVSQEGCEFFGLCLDAVDLEGALPGTALFHFSDEFEHAIMMGDPTLAVDGALSDLSFVSDLPVEEDDLAFAFGFASEWSIIGIFPWAEHDTNSHFFSMLPLPKIVFLAMFIFLPLLAGDKVLII
jgi:hypothetical protein